MFSIRRPEMDCRVIELNSFSAMFNQLPCFLRQLHRLLVHASDRKRRVIRLGIGFQHILHACGKLGVGVVAE